MKVDVPEVMEIVLVKCEKRRKNLSVGEFGCERMGWFKVRGHFYINLELIHHITKFQDEHITMK